MSTLEFVLPGSRWSVVLTPTVERALLLAAQTESRSPERLGELFARDVQPARLEIGLATEAMATRAGRTKIEFDVGEMARNRRKRFREGWHFVGLWHTHPEPCPEPSATDLLLAQDHAAIAGEVLTGILFVIVGNRGPASIRCWVQEAKPPSGSTGLLPLRLNRSR